MLLSNQTRMRNSTNESRRGKKDLAGGTGRILKGQENEAFELEETHAGKRRIGTDADQPSNPNGSSKIVADVIPGPEDIDDPQIRRRFLLNIGVISLAFMFLFTAFQSMAALQSTINPGVGTTSLAVIYITMVLSCMFVPSILIDWLGSKWTMALCMLVYSFYIIAMFFPSNATLIPAAIILGIGASPLWISKCSYFTRIGILYAKMTNERSEVIINKFFGFFFLLFQFSAVWGNIIASTVLSTGRNETEVDENELATCGVYYCTWDHVSGNTTNKNLERPEDSKINLMFGLFLVCALIAPIIVAIFVDPIKQFGEHEKGSSAKWKDLTFATIKHFLHPYQLLILPLTIWSGVEQGFLTTEFTAAFVGCGLGVHMVGYVLITYGVVDAIGSNTFGFAIRKLGRLPIFTLAALVNATVLVWLFFWMPDPNNSPLFFLAAGLWGLSDAIWQTQINAFYGYVFIEETEAAFSNYRLWESIGFIIGYTTPFMLCVGPKIILCIIMLLIGILGYYAVEYLEANNSIKRHSDNRLYRIHEIWNDVS